jgi:hypothetical protein
VRTDLTQRLATVGIVRKVRNGKAGMDGSRRLSWECPLCGHSHHASSGTGERHLQHLERQHAVARPGWPRDWIVRGRIPANAADQIRKAIEECRNPGVQRFIFDDWDALDPAVFGKSKTFRAFVTVFPK